MSLPKKIIKVIGDGRITIPKKFREELRIKEKSVLEGYVTKNKIVLEVIG